MKTTIDIPEKELKDAMKFTKAKTKRDAVVQALEDFNRRQRMADLIKYTGTFKSMATMKEIDALDLARTKQIFGE
jgi:Bacterial antitoxin of type II TA system, VapB